MLKYANISLAVAAATAAWLLISFKDRLTVRAIHAPSPPYVLPYSTHGGVVYVSQGEHNIILFGWGLTGALIVMQLVLNYLKSKRK